MKLLLVSDLHYALKQFDWVYGAAAQFDIVAIAGDHLDISAIVALEPQIIVISKYLTQPSGENTAIGQLGQPRS